MTFSYNPGGGPDEFPNSRTGASPALDPLDLEALRYFAASLLRSDIFAANHIFGLCRELEAVRAELNRLREENERQKVEPKARCVFLALLLDTPDRTLRISWHTLAEAHSHDVMSRYDLIRFEDLAQAEIVFRLIEHRRGDASSPVPSAPQTQEETP